MNPTPAPAPNPVPPTPSGGSAPNFENNIPVHSQGPAGNIPPPENGEDELDKIMQDVGKELKKDDKKPAKKHLLSFARKSNKHSQAKFHAQPVPRVKPGAQPTPVPIPQQHALNRPQPKPPAPVAAPQPHRGNYSPILVALLTVVVTCSLIALAIFTYKNN